MTLIKVAFAVLLALFNFAASRGQDLVKKRKYKDGVTEEFFVLKEDKKIRHGSTIITFNDIFNRQYIVEFGQYDQNKKSGKWLSFYFGDPSNPLKSIGDYSNDLKQGEWRYYYPGNASNNSMRTLLGGEKRTIVVEPKKNTKVFQIAYDTTGQQIISRGKYIDDEKVGIWNYYSRSGYLLHSYNHDSKELVRNNLADPDNDFLVYLGGPERFFNYYHTQQQDEGESYNFEDFRSHLSGR